MQWEELYETKPDDDYEDPADVSAIKEAKDNMGDYKLKTAKDYVVPDHLRMNVDKARGRLLILKDLVGYFLFFLCVCNVVLYTCNGPGKESIFTTLWVNSADGK